MNRLFKESSESNWGIKVQTSTATGAENCEQVGISSILGNIHYGKCSKRYFYLYIRTFDLDEISEFLENGWLSTDSLSISDIEESWPTSVMVICKQAFLNWHRKNIKNAPNQVHLFDFKYCQQLMLLDGECFDLELGITALEITKDLFLNLNEIDVK